MHSNALYRFILLISLTGCGGFVSTQAPVEDRAQARAPASARVPEALPAPAPPPVPAQRGALEQSEMLFQVLTSIGVDYTYAGSSPVTGFDCSGLVAHVFHQGYGITLPRNTRGQSQVGEPVTADALQPGDLVFYNTLNLPFSHVGIYLGDGRFVHAPRTGAAVRIENLKSSYWVKRWNGARRVAVRM